MIPSEASSPERVNWWLGLLVTLALSSVTVYMFPSGGFQYVDLIIVPIIAIAFLFFNSELEDRVRRHVLFLLFFVIWASIVNIGFFLYYQYINILYKLINMIYIFFILYAFSVAFAQILKKQALSYIYIGLVLSIIAIFTISGNYEWTGARNSYSFNNPNQLGLYAIILYATVLLLMRYKQEFNINNYSYFIIDIGLIIVSQFLLWQAISRSALAASLFLHFILIKNIFSKRLFVPIFLALTVCFSYILVVNPTYIQERIAARNPEKLAPGFVQRRVESCILLPLEHVHGIQILIGTSGTYVINAMRGENSALLGAKRSYLPEVHNMFANVLATYGLIGLGFFLWWILKSILECRIIKDGLWVWAAILTYSFGGVIYRFRPFWILVALMMALINIKIQSKIIMDPSTKANEGVEA